MRTPAVSLATPSAVPTGSDGGPRRYWLAGALGAGAVGVAWAALGKRWAITGDSFWGLRTGQWILAHGRVPVHPLFTWAVHGAWVNLEWGWDVLSAGLVHAFGYRGLWVWPALATGGIAWAMRRRLGTAGWLPALLLITTFLGLLGTWRAEWASYALWPVWMAILLTAPERPRLSGPCRRCSCSGRTSTAGFS